MGAPSLLSPPAPPPGMDHLLTPPQQTFTVHLLGLLSLTRAVGTGHLLCPVYSGWETQAPSSLPCCPSSGCNLDRSDGGGPEASSCRTGGQQALSDACDHQSPRSGSGPPLCECEYQWQQWPPDLCFNHVGLILTPTVWSWSPPSVPPDHRGI